MIGLGKDTLLPGTPRVPLLIRGRNARSGESSGSRRAARSSTISNRGCAPACQLELISQKSKLAEAIRYALSRWDGLTRFLDDGRIEIDSNVVERTIRPIALNRKNALYAGFAECPGFTAV